MAHRVVPLMYLLDDRGGVGHGTAGRSSTIQGIQVTASLNKLFVPRSYSCDDRGHMGRGTRWSVMGTEETRAKVKISHLSQTSRR